MHNVRWKETLPGYHLALGLESGVIFKGDVTALDEAQAEAALKADLGELVQSEPTKLDGRTEKDAGTLDKRQKTFAAAEARESKAAAKEAESAMIARVKKSSDAVQAKPEEEAKE